LTAKDGPLQPVRRSAGSRSRRVEIDLARDEDEAELIPEGTEEALQVRVLDPQIDARLERAPIFFAARASSSAFITSSRIGGEPLPSREQLRVRGKRQRLREDLRVDRGRAPARPPRKRLQLLPHLFGGEAEDRRIRRARSAASLQRTVCAERRAFDPRGDV
jgi:hypothetical protein